MAKWGDPRDKQISAFFRGKISKPVAERKFLGITTREAGVELEYKELNTENGDTVPDDVVAMRKFQHRCRLIAAVNVLSSRESNVNLYLYGFYSNVLIDISATRFEYDPSLTDSPVADITFSVSCTRRGELEGSIRVQFVVLTFKDPEEMKKTVVATTVAPDPETVTRYVRSGHRARSSDSLLWPLAAGIVLGTLLD